MLARRRAPCCFLARGSVQHRERRWMHRPVKMSSLACLLSSCIRIWCCLPLLESSFARAPSPREYAWWLSSKHLAMAPPSSTAWLRRLAWSTGAGCSRWRQRRRQSALRRPSMSRGSVGAQAPLSLSHVFPRFARFFRRGPCRLGDERQPVQPGRQPAADRHVPVLERLHCDDVLCRLGHLPAQGLQKGRLSLWLCPGLP